MTDTDTIKMLYDGYNCVADYNDADNLLRYYITPGLDENVLVYDVDNSEEYFYLHDGLGTVRQIINDTQTIENNYDYEGFGTSISHSENIYNRYRYTGREYDKETESDPDFNGGVGTKDGLYYYRARTYDTSIGSFTSRDPIPAINLYPYCSANPVNATDPSGKLMVHGNWCGAGGGGIPVDAVDSCCKKHDACYAAAGAAGVWGVIGPNPAARLCDKALLICVTFADCDWGIRCNCARHAIKAFFALRLILSPNL